VLGHGLRNGSSCSKGERPSARSGFHFDPCGPYREAVSQSPSVSLLEVEPDLADVLSDEQRAEAQRLWLPAAGEDKAGDVAGLLEQSGAFGAIVLEGMLIQALQISEDPTLRLIGPGSFVPLAHPPRSMPVTRARLLVPIPTRLVLLDDQLLIAARRWPWIVSGLYARMLEHSDRLATQLAICQLPRVEDRLMALMWLLAELWGRVTPAGIRLEISLSHEVLGGLVGARRPTVTLALSKLAERGSLIRHEDEWLILEAPVAPVSTEPTAPQLLLTARGSSAWAAHDGRSKTRKSSACSSSRSLRRASRSCGTGVAAASLRTKPVAYRRPVGEAVQRHAKQQADFLARQRRPPNESERGPPWSRAIRAWRKVTSLRPSARPDMRGSWIG
jgi:CRP/FNR family transcriptional regulator, cyclic AMP receptor protein